MLVVFFFRFDIGSSLCVVCCSLVGVSCASLIVDRWLLFVVVGCLTVVVLFGVFFLFFLLFGACSLLCVGS